MTEPSDWLCSQCGEWHSDHKKAETTKEPSAAAMQEAREIATNIVDFLEIKMEEDIYRQPSIETVAKLIAAALDRHAAAERDRCIEILRKWMDPEMFPRLFAAIRSAK